MAESLVVQPPQRFYCHLCNVEIENISSEFTCPLCAGGFIEALPPPSEQNNSEDVEMSDEYNNRLTDQISSLLMSSIGGARVMDDDSDQSLTMEGATSGGSTGNNVGNRFSGRQRNRRRTTQDLPNFDNIMHEFLISITGGGTGAPMFFMGNPGDYAWGREGMDTVITHMLNQMENSGPPPLSKEKIEDIPRIEIDLEQVDRKLQCSVCWDDFLIQELVRKLPCTHIYHENCIVPWLELHGTCPVCRKTVDKEPVEEQTQFSGLNNISNRLGQVYRALNYLHGDNESVSSVSSDGAGDPTSSVTSHQQPQPHHQNQYQLQTNSSLSTQQSTSVPPSSDSNSSSTRRRDDDGNVEYDYD